MGRLIDITGNKYGRLTVVSRDRESPGNARESMWRCTCDCGKQVTINAYSLKSGSTTSCGCYNQEKRRSRAVHGMSNSKLHRVWRSMKQRCLNPKDKGFEDYGGRGICVDSAWLKYKGFMFWAVESGYRHGLMLDRIDVNGNYSPANCRWVTDQQSLINRRKNKTWTTSRFKGVHKTKGGKWFAVVQVGGTRHYSDKVVSEGEAAKLYDELAIKHHGEYACLNFPANCFGDL